MNDPPRLLDPKSGAPLSRSLLRAGVDMGPPPGAKEQVWSSVSSALGGALAVGSVKAASMKAAASAVDAASSAGSSGSAAAANAGAGGAAKLTGLKLMAGKWIFLSSLSLVVAGGAAYRVLGASSSSSTARAIPAGAKDAKGNAMHGGLASPTNESPIESNASRNDTVGGDSPTNNAPASDAAAANASPIDSVKGHSADAMDASESGPARLAQSTKASKSDGGLASTRPLSSKSLSKGASGLDSKAGRAAESDTKAPSAGAVGPDAVADADPNPSKPSGEASGGAAPDGSSRLLAESAALVDSRMELQSGNAAGAIQALQNMDKRFGGGGLSQERAALLVQALAANGQRDEAKRQADAFLAAYPASPLTARVRPFASH